MSQHNSPLRYPGGKQKLAPFVREVLEANDLIGGEYVEPYAGGAGVAIELLTSGVVSSIHLNDVWRPIAAFWRAVINRTDEFCDRIVRASMTIPEWRKQREIMSRHDEFDDLELGFSFFFLNRCNRSGIPNAGVIGGLDQTGEWKMDARFPRSELVRRIQLVGENRHKISVYNYDAEIFLQQYATNLPSKTLIYCDPPYFQKADRLYLNHYSEKDHERLSTFIQDRIPHRWLISYDSAPEILRAYGERRKFVYDLQYNAFKAYVGREVFVFSDELNIPAASSIPAIDHALRQVS